MFTENVYKQLYTLTTNLTQLEIGNCDSIGHHLEAIVNRLVNLRMLKLEYYYGLWTNDSIKVFDAIKHNKNLKILELVNISFTIAVIDKLKMCEHIKHLLIIPRYNDSNNNVSFLL